MTEAVRLLAVHVWEGHGSLLTSSNSSLSLPEVRDLDINPLLVTPTGVLALDVKIRVAAGRTDDGLAQRDPSPVHQPRSTS